MLEDRLKSLENTLDRLIVALGEFRRVVEEGIAYPVITLDAEYEGEEEEELADDVPELLEYRMPDSAMDGLDETERKRIRELIALSEKKGLPYLWNADTNQLVVDNRVLQEYNQP
jgi:hypothetical protein